MRHDLKLLQDEFGIIFPHARGYADEPEGRQAGSRALSASMALDAGPALNPAQGQLVTSPNASIPAFYLNFVDPEVARVLISPTKAAEIFGQKKQGDWESTTITFTMVEAAGETSSYGDDSENGMSDANANWEFRQIYLWQTITKWGELQLARAGKAKLDWVAEQNIASAQTLRTFENQVFFFGVAGLQNYGLLNDPALSAPIVPTTKVAGGTSWNNATGTEVLADIALLVQQAITQSGGVSQLDSPMVLAMSPQREAVGLTKTTDFNVNVMDRIKKNYPNLRVETAVQYSTAGGELLQLIVEEVEGQKVGYCSFAEKLRAHRIVEAMSSYKQKKSAGAAGAVIRFPALISQMLGV